MKHLLIIMAFAFVSNTTKSMAQIPLDMMVSLFYKCVKDTVYEDVNNLIRSNDPRLDAFLLDMKPGSYGWYDSTGFQWSIDFIWGDLQITRDTFERKVISWIDSTNAYYSQQGLGDTCIHYGIYRLYRLNLQGAHEPNLKAKVSPNPGQFIYTIAGARGLLRVYNTMGELLLEKQISPTNNHIELNGPTGLYYFHIEQNNRLETHRIIHSP